jgi:hypothetical protein
MYKNFVVSEDKDYLLSICEGKKIIHISFLGLYGFRVQDTDTDLRPEDLGFDDAMILSILASKDVEQEG